MSDRIDQNIGNPGIAREPAPVEAESPETLSYEDLQGRCWYLEHQLAECLPWLQALTRHISAPNETLEALIQKLGGTK